MNTLFGRFLSLAVALVLALPPGFCCGSVAASAEEVPVREGCCGDSRGQFPPLDEGGSAPSKTKCNCSQDATVAAWNHESLQDLPHALLDFAVSIPEFDPATVDVRGNSHPIDPPPPIRIVQCVWRC